MASNPSGKIAFITGGASGIGAALSTELVDEGAEVWIADRQVGSAEELAQRLNSSGGKAHAIACDVRSYPSFERVVAEAVQQSGRDPDPHRRQVRAVQRRQRCGTTQILGAVSTDGTRKVRRARPSRRFPGRRDHCGAGVVEGMVVPGTPLAGLIDAGCKTRARARAWNEIHHLLNPPHRF
jgi:NAD(P)-dependent dehydrogenase (short-subunit alcohol dehydrogenase family)